MKPCASKVVPGTKPITTNIIDSVPRTFLKNKLKKKEKPVSASFCVICLHINHNYDRHAIFYYIILYYIITSSESCPQSENVKNELKNTHTFVKMKSALASAQHVFKG